METSVTHKLETLIELTASLKPQNRLNEANPANGQPNTENYKLDPCRQGGVTPDQNFPVRTLPMDVSQYYSSGPMTYTSSFRPIGGGLVPPPTCPVVTTRNGNRMNDSGTKPWSVHPPDPSGMKEHLRKYRNDHKISGFAGFFPGTHNMLGGSIYRIVTLEQEAERKPYAPYKKRQ